MKFLFEQIELGLEHKIHYLALFAAVSIPDIAAALQSESYLTDGKKYRNWFDKYMSPLKPNKYGETGQLKAQHLWEIRCSLFHQGTSSDKKDFKRLLFIEPPYDTYMIHCCIVGSETAEKSLLIEVDTFCRDMITAGQKWMQENAETPAYKKNMSA